METSQTVDSLESKDDLLEGDEGIWQYWDIQESIAEKEERSWRVEGNRIEHRYRDERSGSQQAQHIYNILWSNVQTLKPALYGRMPEPDCERRFRDQDDVGRLASEILERSLKYTVENHGMDDAVKAAVEDFLLPGRGVVRVLYVPHFDDEDEVDEKDTAGDEVAAETGAPGAEEQPGDGEASSVENRDDLEPASTSAGQPPIPASKPNAPAAESGAEPEPPEAEDQGDLRQTPKHERKVVWEETHLRYVHWEDYMEGAARQEVEVPWVRFRSFMTRDELIKRFGKKKAKKVTLDYTPKGISKNTEDTGAPPDAFKKAIVHETWDKASKEVIWWAPGTPGLVLDRQPDPLKCRGFFPRPDPLLATTTTGKRIPVPDYHQYKDQADELDELSNRLYRLQRALKVFGIYPGEEKQTLQQLINDSNENLLIPVEDWAGIMEKGGLKGVIEWFPVEQVAQAMIQLYEARDKAKQVIYEITGIADIMRGATAPEETATAQNLKSQFATLRTSERQKMVARFCRDLIRLAGDIIAEHFEASTISIMTGYPQLLPVPPQPVPPQLPPAIQHALAIWHIQAQQQTTQTMIGQPPPAPPQMPPELQQAMQQYQQQEQIFQQQMQAYQAVITQNAGLQKQFDAAIALIKDDVRQNFRIDIEADSTIAVDENKEKQARVEFLEQMVPLIEQVIPMAQGNPEIASLAKEITLFAARGFKTGRSLEEALEKAFDAVAKMQQNPKAMGLDGKHAQQTGKSPAGELAMAQAHEKDAQLQAHTDDVDSQRKFTLGMAKLSLQKAEAGAKINLERERMEHENVERAQHLAIEHDKAQSEQQLRAARALHMEAGAAANIV